MKSNYNPPSFVGKVINYGFKQNLDLKIEHFLGPKIVYKMHMKRVKSAEDVAFLQYRYQLRLRKKTSELAPSICLDFNTKDMLQAKMPLSDTERLGCSSLPFGVTIMHGEKDWIYVIDNGQSKKLIELRRQYESING